MECPASYLELLIVVMVIVVMAVMAAVVMCAVALPLLLVHALAQRWRRQPSFCPAGEAIFPSFQRLCSIRQQVCARLSSCADRLFLFSIFIRNFSSLSRRRRAAAVAA